MSEQPRKPVVVLKLTSVDPNDPAAVLEAVRDLFRARGEVLRVIGGPKESAAEAPTDARRIAREQLEAAALDEATRVLRERQAEATRTAEQQTAAAPSPPQSRWAKIRQGALKCLENLRSAGWKITVDLVAAFAKRGSGL